jgi:hypothetical protein
VLGCTMPPRHHSVVPITTNKAVVEVGKIALVVVVKVRGILEMGAPLARFPERHAWDTV